ncbi:unnamed protein product [Ophioblennius macclurei]
MDVDVSAFDHSNHLDQECVPASTGAQL